MKIRIVISTILLVLFALTLSIAFFASNVRTKILKPEALTDLTMESMMSNEALPYRIREALFFQSWYSEEGLPMEYKMMGTYIHNDQFGQLLDVIMPLKDRQSILSNVYQSVFTWFDNEDIYPSLIIDLSPTMENVSQNTLEIAKWALSGALPLPPCTPERLAEMEAGNYGSDLMEVMTCYPPPEYQDEFAGVISSLMSDMIADYDVPVSINVAEMIQEQVGEPEVIAMKDQVKQMRKLFKFIWLLPLLLLGVVVALVVRSWNNLITWVRWPIFAVGLFGYLLATFLQSPRDWLMSQMMPPPDIIPLPAIAPILVAFAESIMTKIGSALIWQMGIVLVIGSGLLIYSYRSSLSKFFLAVGKVLKKWFEVRDRKLVNN